MQTVLGAGGQIAVELTRALATYTDEIRLVSRHPKAVNPGDQLLAADLTDAEATDRAVAGSKIAYLTVGLPIDSALWEQKFPMMMANTIAACEKHGTKLVFFDNTYMYPRTAVPQTESAPFEPVGRKSQVRARMATDLLTEMSAGRIEALIARAPEFYGPGKTQSITNTMVFDRIRAGKRPFVPLTPDAHRSLVWTPDASRAMALLGNNPDAYDQTWHLPVDPTHPTYREMIAMAEQVTGRSIGFTRLPRLAFTVGARFNPALKETGELVPRYAQDNIFDASKFTTQFPEFEVTSTRSGIEQILVTPVA